MDDQNDVTFLEQAFECYHAYAYEEAIPLFEKAIQASGTLEIKGVLFAHAGFCYAKLGEYGDAKTYFDQGVKLAPEHSVVFFMRGCLFMLDKKWADAVKDFDKALELEPTAATAWNNKGGCLANLGDVVGAEKCLQKSLEINQLDTVVLENLAKFYSQQYEFGKALGCVVKSICLKRRRGERDAELFFYAAVCYRNLEDYARATKAAQRAIKIDSNNGAAYEELGDIMVAMPKSNYVLAAINYTEALKRLKDTSIINKLAGVVEASKALHEAKHIVVCAQHGKMTIEALVQEMTRVFSVLKQKTQQKK